MKRAFTLIELLVVIAIIAILAAILFPVFAQAKAAAKAAASISNVKQMSLGALMYSGDADDNLPLAGDWSSSDPDAVPRTTDARYASWTITIQPYMKNLQILASPLTSPPTPRTTGYGAASSNLALNQRQAYTRFNTYGYNAAYLSPSAYDGVYKMYSLSATAVNRPANTVFFAEKSNPLTSGLPNYHYGAFQAYLQESSVEPPDCATVPDFLCYFGWGNDYLPFTSITTEAEGKYTGGVAFRNAGTCPVAYVDGHVKKQTMGALAAGTTWAKGTVPDANITVSDPTKYQWDYRN